MEYTPPRATERSLRYRNLKDSQQDSATGQCSVAGGWKKWLWYGGAAIGAGTAVYLTQQKNQEEGPLPEPPPLP